MKSSSQCKKKKKKTLKKKKKKKLQKDHTRNARTLRYGVSMALSQDDM